MSSQVTLKGIEKAITELSEDLKRKENLELAYGFLFQTLRQIAEGEHPDEAPEVASEALKTVKRWLGDE